MRLLQTVILALFVAIGAYGQCDSDVDLRIISQIESSNNPEAFNAAGPGSRDDSYGMYQITVSCLQAYNKAHRTTILFTDLCDTRTNRKIARWYLNKEIPRLLTHHGIPITVRNKIICYNAGIRYLVKGLPLPAITEGYIKKYEKLCAGLH